MIQNYSKKVFWVYSALLMAFWGDFGSFKKKTIFFDIGPSTPWENAIIAVILAILAHFTILKIGSKKTERHMFAKNILFD